MSMKQTELTKTAKGYIASLFKGASFHGEPETPRRNAGHHPDGLASLQYPALLSAIARLFQGDKSMWASANGIKMTFEKNSSAPNPASGCLFTKFRKLLNSL